MKQFWILLSIFFLITSCEDKYRIVDLKTLKAEGPIHVSDSLVKDTITGISYYSLYGPAGFGTIFNFYIPDSLKGKNIDLVFSCKARTNYGHSAAAICARTVDKEGKLLTWYSGNLRYHFTDINVWCPVKDSIMFRLQGWLEPYYCINVFTYLPASTKEIFDVDSLQVQFKVKD